MEDVPSEQHDATQKKRPKSSFLASWLRLGERSGQEERPFSARAWNSFESFFGGTVKPPETLATATEAAQSFEVLDSEPGDDAEFVQPKEGGELFINHEEQTLPPSNEYLPNNASKTPSEEPTINPFEEFEAQLQREQGHSVQPEQENQLDSRGEIDFERRHEVKDEPAKQEGAEYADQAPIDTAYQTETEKIASTSPPIYAPPVVSEQPDPTEYSNNQTMYKQAVRRGFWAGILVLAICWLIYIVH